MKYKCYFIAFLGFAFLACKHEPNPLFSPSNLFQLSPPRIEVDSFLFKGSASIKVDFQLENAETHYTKDDSKVTKSSTQYKEPITVQNSGTFNFKNFHPDYKPSEKINIRLVKIVNDISTSKTTVSPNPHPSYMGAGAHGLIDLRKGGTEFRSGTEWLGFQSKIVTIQLDFEKQLEISKLILSTLSDHNSWIFSPEAIQVFHRTEKIGDLVLPEPTIHQEKKLSFMEIPIKRDTYSNLEIQIHLLKEIPNWHQGKGTTPFFFIDEVIVE